MVVTQLSLAVGFYEQNPNKIIIEIISRIFNVSISSTETAIVGLRTLSVLDLGFIKENDYAIIISAHLSYDSFNKNLSGLVAPKFLKLSDQILDRYCGTPPSALIEEISLLNELSSRNACTVEPKIL